MKKLIVQRQNRKATQLFKTKYEKDQNPNYILIYNKCKGDNLVAWSYGPKAYLGSYIEQISTVRLEQN